MKPKGIQCPDDLSRAVKALITTKGEASAAQTLGLSRASAVRLAAGLTAHAGTIAQACAALAAQPVTDPRQLSLPATEAA